jgi:hypothetical protein
LDGVASRGNAELERNKTSPAAQQGMGFAVDRFSEEAGVIRHLRDAQEKWMDLFYFQLK